jgi:hypothetical protein
VTRGTPRSYRLATHPPEEAQIVNVRGQDVRLPTTIVGSYPRPQFLRRKVFPIGCVNSPEFGLRALRPGKYGR